MVLAYNLIIIKFQKKHHIISNMNYPILIDRVLLIITNRMCGKGLTSN